MSNIVLRSFVVLCTFLAGSAAAEPIFLFQDVETQPVNRGSEPDLFTRLGETVYFFANDGLHGRELWVSDGTPEGTGLLSDLCPGACSAYSQPLRVFHDKLFFQASTAEDGNELWASDGTSEGTALFKQLVPGAGGITLDTVAEYGGRLYLVGYSSGAPACVGHTRCVWSTDGTPQGTVLTQELFPDPSSRPGPIQLFSTGSLLYWSQQHSQTSAGDELWVYDGLERRRLLSGNGPVDPIVGLPDGRLLFATSGSPSRAWVSDGTAAGTQPIEGVEPKPYYVSTEARGAVLGTKVLFAASQGSGNLEPWLSDGTVAGTTPVRELRPADTSSNPHDLFALDGRLLSVAGNGAESSLWGSDGTAGGPQSLAPSATGAVYARLGDRALVSDFFGSHKLWTTDGTSAGTQLVKDLDPDFAVSGPSARFPFLPISLPQGLTAAGSALFMVGLKSDGGSELWKSDGTTTGTGVVKGFDVEPIADIFNAGPRELTVLGGRVLFSGFSTAAGREPWVSDGTTAGTHLVADLVPGALGSAPSDFLALGGGRVVFAASDDAHGRELWLSDGTAEGTLLVEDLAPGVAASSPEGLTLVGDKVVFSADDATHGRELFAVRRTDLPGAPSSPPCAPDRLCLHDGRFEVGVVWRDFQGNTGPGQVVPGVASDDSGLFWFFQPANYEFLVKVLRGCEVNGHFWVLAAATTNVEYTLTVTDTTTGERATYTNPLGRSSPAIIDIEALDDCP